MVYCNSYGYGYGYNNCYNSAWYSWGRWVLFGAVVLAFILFFFLCSCWSQRRRRKAGRQPFYGTGWTQNLPLGGGSSYGNNSQNKTSYQAPPPQYGQENNYNQHEGFYGQNTGGQNQSYFGGRQTELEMQPPQNVYGARDQSGFAPPPGPPPSKVH